MLPPELIDHIFGFLQAPALKACSAAHPLYSRLAERHLYASVVLTTADPAGVQKFSSNNSRILNYPRTLEVYLGLDHFQTLEGLSSILSMMPRMPNLVSLNLCGYGWSLLDQKDFLSTFRNCFQESSIEELYLRYLTFPLSILDTAKNIKELTLINCIPMEEPMSNSSSPQQDLETLVFCGHTPSSLLLGLMRRVSCLTSLELCDLNEALDWAAFAKLLSACSTLRKLRVGLNYEFQSVFSCSTDHHVGGQWSGSDQFPFTLSALRCLKELSVSAIISSRAETEEILCALPGIVQLINTAPSLQALVLRFGCVVPDIALLARLDWTPLDRVQANSAGILPSIELCIGGQDRFFSPESILDALAGNEALMSLVKRDVVILKPE